jgi:hypothetical protein
MVVSLGLALDAEAVKRDLFINIEDMEFHVPRTIDTANNISGSSNREFHDARYCAVQ